MSNYLYCLPSHAAAFAKLKAAHINQPHAETWMERVFGVRPQPYITASGTGVIPISGIIGYSLPALEKELGGVDVFEVIANVDRFSGDPSVKRIAFNVNSPGGTVIGMPELADRIYGIKKPTMAYTATLAASAGYYAGSQADSFASAPSALVGSIGVIMADMSYSVAYEQAGVKPEVFRSTEHKAPNAAGEGYTDAQRAENDRMVSMLYEQFKDRVLRMRKRVEGEALDGRIFIGTEAAQLGLVNALYPTFTEALYAFEKGAA